MTNFFNSAIFDEHIGNIDTTFINNRCISDDYHFRSY